MKQITDSKRVSKMILKNMQKLRQINQMYAASRFTPSEFKKLNNN